MLIRHARWSLIRMHGVPILNYNIAFNNDIRDLGAKNCVYGNNNNDNV